ncbi:AAA family ATPase [Psychrobacter sp. PSP]|uniref:AAA family ATPase n=1 Tax=Psychrobacter sp. PSP TaxID=2734636 RepID=UPI0033A4A65E
MYTLKLHRNIFFYIDTLRSLKNLKSIENTKNLVSPLLLRTHQDYRFSKEQIISGEDFFDFLTDSLLGMPEERQRIYDYQVQLSHYFFNNEIITLIPHRKEESLHIKIGEAKQFPISQLGDGLQQVIILTYKAFLTTEPSFFFIEEPEMHLHAGYVKQLMKFLLNETDHYYMATSHSNYLLDMINEDNRIALYRVDKKQMNDEENKYETVIKRCDGDRTVLQTLGVSPSSVFLANCTIWVEGITDRLYFVQYLKKYLEELKEIDKTKWEDYSRFIDGYHYAFVEYQGSNLEHWDFEVDSLEAVDSSKNKGLNAILITSNALVIADADLTKKPRFNELEKQLGDKIAITQGKETENSLPKKFLIKKFFEMCPDNGLAKQGNKKKLDYSDDYEKYFTDSYQTSTKGVGKYFDNVLSKMRKDGVIPKLENNEKSFTFSNGKQGTIKSKTGFCRDIVELMQSESWKLTPSATELCESIFQHIKANNY